MMRYTIEYKVKESNNAIEVAQAKNVDCAYQLLVSLVKGFDENKLFFVEAGIPESLIVYNIKTGDEVFRYEGKTSRTNIF